ncbi:histidinol-phosphatase HisJ [Metabacillus idriensis]|uniref:histidinol-phosphatase HisJ n=1 Tax=Metabacillus idriensis TaxID=324768 RepID=UPI0028130632|nr:histidinol-phosphatase HisJ [Metabacillus idriensis]MDR0138046.1 histidinol-phosphatase HisJ [Metabacillus idriensis]
MRKKDGHVHTPFCPHGSADSFEMYIEKALKMGLEELTFTEHAPLPAGFSDPVPDKDSAMNRRLLNDYISQLLKVKEKYSNDIKINLGFEIDYIEGFERETESFLSEYGQYIDDAVLSVHFLKLNGQYYCADFHEITFEQMIEAAGSLKLLHIKYYETMLAAVKSNLGPHKPKRLGHLTLINKFQKRFPADFNIKDMQHDLLHAVKEQNMELDFNVAGLRKDLCGAIYLHPWMISEAKKQNIPLIYGSDAHSAKDVGAHYSLFEEALF